MSIAKNIDIDNLHCLIDLHIHLDGAISLASAKQLAELQNIDIPNTDEEILDLFRVTDVCENFSEFLSKFYFSGSLLQTQIGIKTAVCNLLNELKDQGVMYTEIRFAPQLSTVNGLSQEEVVKAAIAGLNDVSDIKAQLILCCMRGNDTYSANIETIDVASKYLGKGICAIDLAGSEDLYPTQDYAREFEHARELNVPYIIHAGEVVGPESVHAAIRFKAKRIGHGIRSIEDENLVKYLAEHKIPLEICPTSNLITGAFSDINNYPFKLLYDAGVVIIINTDDPAIIGTDIKSEYKLLIKQFNLDLNDIYKLLMNAVNCSFASDDTKIELVNKINKEFEVNE